MVRKKAVNKNRSNIISHDVTPFKPLFDELFDGSVNAKIDPFCCIPFANVRNKSINAVQRLVSLFDSKYDQGDQSISTGLALGSDVPIVVPFSGSLLHHVRDYFSERGHSKSEVDSIVARYPVWYGIIDGYHHNLAVRWLKENDSRWSNFLWYVTIIKGCHGIQTYRQLARFQNHRHNPKFYFEMTLFDELNNLRMEYDRLCKDKKKVTNMDVARSYFGSSTVNRTLSMMASTAIRLPMSVLKELGIIMNNECPSICLNDDALNAEGAATEDQVMRKADCRVYRSFVRLNSLYCSKNFMNPDTKFGDKVQINTLYRVKDLYALNGYKTVQHEQVTEQYKLSLDALLEEEKFLKYLKADKWPAGTTTIRQNLLQSTVMDEELVANRGNDTVILDTLRSSLLRIDRDLVCRLDNIWSKSAQTQADQSGTQVRELSGAADGNENNPPPNECIPDPNAGAAQTQNVDTTSAADLDMFKKLQDMKRLKSRGVETYNMPWEYYLTSQWREGNEKVDLVITQPPTAPSRSPIPSVSARKGIEEISLNEITSFPSDVKRILKPNGYVILILPFFAYMEWYTSFNSAGYDIMPSPYVLAFDSNTVQNRNSTAFPQCGYTLGLVARYSTDTPKFNPDFQSHFNLVNCSNRRNCSVMFNIQKPSSKLCKPNSRIPFYSDELSPFMLAELIDLFTPKDGKVLDPFSGTMTTSIAAMHVGRRCVCIERNSDCYNAAVGRLRKNLPSSNNINQSSNGGLNTAEETLFAQLEQVPDANNMRQEVGATQLDIPRSKMETDAELLMSVSTSTEPSAPSPSHASSAACCQENDAQNYSISTSRKERSFDNDRTVNGNWNSRTCDKQVHECNDGLNEHRHTSSTRKRPRLTSSDVHTSVQPFLKKRVAALRPTFSFKHGQQVTLLHQNKEVGSAFLQEPRAYTTKETHPYVTCLHGHDLKRWEIDRQKLVVITKVSIDNNFKSISNPYDFNVGIEDAPERLGDMLHAGLYPWDLHMMSE